VTFAEARARFPVLDRIAYLNAGTFGPLAASTARAMAAEVERDLAEGRSGLEYLEHALRLRARVREALARLVGAPAEHVALTTSTTDGCNVVVAGLGLSPRDEVVTTTDEHPGLLLPLRVSGARVVVVPPDPDAILAAVTPRTRLVAVSQVLWTTGRVLPVAELRAASGVPILVDGAQSVGAIPVAASGVDFLTISGQKWLCGPDSTGAVVVADPERLGVTWPSYFSQVAIEPDGAFTPQPGARRFEAGWWSPSVAAGLLDALGTRPPWWHERAVATAERCRALLDERHEVVLPAERSTLVAFRPSGEAPTEVVARLLAHDVHVREIPGTGLVRVSCGWWTSDDDLDRLVAALA
jgi:L-cysteine/cystine lyase